MWTFNEKYDVLVFLAAGDQTPPWEAERWRAISTYVDELAGPMLADAGIRTHQHVERPYKELVFGRLGWDARSHVKWTHTRTTSAIFGGAEVWAPRWTVCEAKARTPDLFLALSPVGDVLVAQPANVLVLALRQGSKWPAVRDIGERIAALTEARYAGHMVRPWGHPSGAGYSRAVQDLPHSGLFKRPITQEAALDASSLEGDWMNLLAPQSPSRTET